MKTNGRTGRRRWPVALVAAIAVLGLVVLLPTLLGRSLALRIFSTRADRLLAPGSLEARAVHLSWFGPTRIVGVALRDGQGKRLIAADRAEVGWGLWQILFANPETIPLRLPGAELAIDRGADGRIDLLETLRPIIRPHPRYRLIVEIPDGRLQWSDASLARPIEADRTEIRLEIPRDPDPIQWKVSLQHRSENGTERPQLAIEGTMHREADRPASISLVATRWPWETSTASLAIDGRLSAHRQEGRWSISGEAHASGPSIPDSLGPVRAGWEVAGGSDEWSVGRIELATARGRLEGSGTIQRAGESSRLDLKGTLQPDWAALQADLRRDVEPSARLTGQPGDWRLNGPIGGKIAGELGLHLDGLDVFGLRLEQTRIVVRSDGERLRIDPIDGRLNDGALHLEPEIVREADGPIRVRLGGSSTIQDAVVDDEVSHRVLSFVAPVLDGATRVRGRVSVRGLDAEFPVDRAIGAAAKVTGNVVFNDVQFLPGPLAEDLLDLIPGTEDSEPMLALRDPISVRIADRKVYQHGLALPLGQVGRAELEGSVDFEKHLDLMARFRVNPPRLDRPVLAALLSGAHLEVPIRGTLQEPRIDAEAFQKRLKETGSDLLEGSIVAGAGGLLRLLDRGISRDRQATGENPPAAGPTPEERREIREQRRLERLQRKAERRRRRDGLPD